VTATQRRELREAEKAMCRVLEYWDAARHAEKEAKTPKTRKKLKLIQWNASKLYDRTVEQYLELTKHMERGET